MQESHAIFACVCTRYLDLEDPKELICLTVFQSHVVRDVFMYSTSKKPFIVSPKYITIVNFKRGDRKPK